MKRILLLILLFAATPLVAQTVDIAPTNAPAAVAPAGTATNSPAETAPAVNDSPAPTPSAPQPPLTPPNVSQGSAPQQEDIIDIRPPFFFLHSWFWLWIALAIAATIAVLILIWYWLRSDRQLSAKSAYDLTMEKLEKARALMNEGNPMPYAVLISEAIRSYLGQRFQSPSTRRTTEEFLRLMENDRATPLAEHRDLLKDFLQSCDLVKFARYQPTLTELEEVQQRAFSFVTATKPSPVQRNGRQP